MSTFSHVLFYLFLYFFLWGPISLALWLSFYSLSRLTRRIKKRPACRSCKSLEVTTIVITCNRLVVYFNESEPRAHYHKITTRWCRQCDHLELLYCYSRVATSEDLINVAFDSPRMIRRIYHHVS